MSLHLSEFIYFVLSSNSSVMKEILLNNQHHQPTIYLRGIQDQELQTLLQLMYYGEATFSINRADRLEKVIKEYQLGGFDFLSKNLRLKNFHDSLVKKQSSNKKSAKKEDFKETEKNEEKMLTCNYCDYTRENRSHVKIHQESVHEGIRYECDQCDQITTTKSDLNRHKRIKHEGFKHKCRHCLFSTSQMAGLNRHMKIKHRD